MADQAELDIDIELEELEIRLERLRALYEQYFLGIEKIEPQVARKDVDRRIWLLRREKIRNTAKRFRLQTLIQRYNTFQQYWARICREIENGTYQRHLLKAEKALGQPLTIASKKRLGAFARRTEQLEEEQRAPPTPSPPSRDELDNILGLGGAARPARKAPGEDNEVAKAPPAPEAALDGAHARPRYKLEKLDLDIDDLLGDRKAPVSARPPPSARPVSTPAPVGEEGPPPPSKKPPPLPPRKKPPLPPRAAGSRAVEPPLPSSPSHVAPPSSPSAAHPPPPRVGPPISVRAPAPTPPPGRAPPPPPAAGLSDARMREIHERLSDAKRQVNDTKAVSLEGLARQLRATEESLRRQHGGRSVDFDVVIKDGRAILKPVVKK